MLHIAEWIKYFGAFFNLEDKAEEHFNEVAWLFIARGFKRSNKINMLTNIYFF